MTSKDTTRILDRIVEEDLSGEEARELVASLPRNLDDRQAARLYGVLRAWTWRALDQRRRDDELREWVDLVRRARLRIKNSPRRQDQLETLAELLSESVAVAVRLPLEEVLAKRHVPETLLLLDGADGEPMSKRQLMDALGVEQSNLWRIIKLLEPTGLVESEKSGRERLYRLSRAGQTEVRNIRLIRTSQAANAELEALSEAPVPGEIESPPDYGIMKALEDELRPFTEDGEEDFRKLLKSKYRDAAANGIRIILVDEKSALPVFSPPPLGNMVVANENEAVGSSVSGKLFADG